MTSQLATRAGRARAAAKASYTLVATRRTVRAPRVIHAYIAPSSQRICSSTMLRRLPRALLDAGRRSLNSSTVNGCVARALHAECQRVSHAADASSSWGSAGTVALLTTSAALASSQTFAAEAAVVPAKPDPASTLKGLKRLSDAKEVVLYQYATCPFCNKVRSEWLAPRSLFVTPCAAPAQGVSGLPQDTVQGSGGEPADQKGAQVVNIWQGERSCVLLAVQRTLLRVAPPRRCLCSWWTASS